MQNTKMQSANTFTINYRKSKQQNNTISNIKQIRH